MGSGAGETVEAKKLGGGAAMEWVVLALVIVVAVVGYLVWQATAQTTGDDNEGLPLGVTAQLERSPDGISYDGDGQGVVIRWDPPTVAGRVWLTSYLGGLGFSEVATMARIEDTRALDGTVEASSDEARATWTYHPDDGLRIVVSSD